MPRRRTHLSAAFLEQAMQLFPPGGSADGRPSFQAFEDGPLRGAETAFGLDFDAQREAIEGVGSIRYVRIPPTRFFGPLDISACLMRDGTVEIVSVIADPGYWDLIANDPTD
jgi:hypothetical protein